MIVVPYVNETKVSLTVTAAAIPEAIRRVSKAAKNYVFINVTANGAFLVGYDSEANTAIVKLETSETEGTGSFLLIPETILPVCASRKSDIKFTYCEGNLHFASVKGKYTGDLTSKPLVLDVVTQVNDTISAVSQESSMLSRETYDALWESLTYACISDVFASKETPPLTRFIQATGDTVEASSYDNYHMSLVVSKLPKGSEVRVPFKLAVTDTYTDIMGAVITSNDRGVKLVVTDHTFAARSPDALLFMPPTQSQDGYDIARSYIEDPENEFDMVCTMPASRLKTVMSNCCAVYRAGSTVKVKCTKAGALLFDMTTEYGSIKDEVPTDSIEGSAAFSLEPYSFLDLVNRLADGDPVKLSVAASKCYRLDFFNETTTVVYLGSLHADEE